MKMELVSFVIPCYNCEHTIEAVIDELNSEMQKLSEYDYEIVLVNDGSADNTYEVLANLQKNNRRIVVIDLMKNFGQPSAQMAAFAATRGEYIFSLDDDGQMPLESICDMLKKIKEGYDVVFGRYERIRQVWYRRVGSRINSKMMEVMVGKPRDLYVSSFWVSRKAIIDEIIKYQGPYPYIGGLMLRVSRKMTSITVKERERLYGKSGYTLGKLIYQWMNGFTTFSVVPLRISSAVGIFSALLGFIYGVISVIRKLLNPEILLGYSSLIVVILLMGGIIMILLGMLGEYMGRMYLNINQAPQYVIRNAIDERQ